MFRLLYAECSWKTNVGLLQGLGLLCLGKSHSMAVLESWGHVDMRHP